MPIRIFQDTIIQKGIDGHGITGPELTQIQHQLANSYLADVVNGLVAAAVTRANHSRLAPIVSGQKYNAFSHGYGCAAAPAATSISSGFIYFSLIDIPAEATFDRIGTTVRTAGAGVTARLGVFNIDLVTRVATRIIDAGAIDASTTGDKELTINLTLSPGRYALAITPSGEISINGAPAARGFDWSSTSSIPRATRLMSGVTYGAYASSYTINTANGNVYDTYLRAV